MNLLDFEKNINYSFKNIKLLQQAFYHSSYANEHKRLKINSNERLEFLGDAVLELSISEYIYNNFLSMPEGELTKFRASIVCETTLAKRAKILNIGEFLLLGKGEKLTGGDTRNSILADTFECVIGAIFLDSGLEEAKKFILTQLGNEIPKLKDNFRTMDYKTFLQEVIQKNSKETVKYTIIEEKGPDHNKEFVAQATHVGKILSTGIGKTKKEAEQNAAYNQLKKLNIVK